VNHGGRHSKPWVVWWTVRLHCEKCGRPFADMKISAIQKRGVLHGARAFQDIVPRPNVAWRTIEGFTRGWLDHVKSYAVDCRCGRPIRFNAQTARAWRDEEAARGRPPKGAPIRRRYV
jgi:hypothetical protein